MQYPLHIFTKVIAICYLSCLALTGCKTSKPISLNKKSKSADITYRYQSHINEGETVIKEDYNTILSKTGLGELIYRQIYPEKDFMTKYIEFADPQYLVVSGKYIEWYDNGNLKTKGQCYNDLKEGDWIEYYSSNGIKKAIGAYLQDVKEGEWKQYDLTGVHTKTYTYINGICQEDYVSFDGYGNEFKRKGNPHSVKTLPYLTKYEKLNNAEARDKATFNKIQSMVVSNLVYPSYLRDRGVKGITETLIKIDANGNVQDIEVLSGICQAFSDESLRIAKLFNKWSPATCDGLPCVSEYRLYIQFKTN